jgi:uncharacterized repeat protein (TIGR03803 family)
MNSNWTTLAWISAKPARVLRAALLLTITAEFAALAAQPRRAQTLDVLYSFNGPPDGELPSAPPLRDRQGNLYIATGAGGVSDWGTVVKLDPAGNETVLHSFTGGSDGVTPVSGLTMDAQGNLYGTTSTGGSTNCFDGNGCGIVYELSPSNGGWTETILYVFQGGSDGAYPGNGTLATDGEGNLYGTALYAGSEPWPNGNGVVFKLTHGATGWKQQVVYAFGPASPNSPTPYGGVILDAAGNIYGTTYYGGTYGSGTVYKIDPTGSETVLHNFAGGSKDGGGPMTAPVRDEAGNLYGTTSYGGEIKCAYAIGCGTVFKIAASGAESLLHIFTGYPHDGDGPGPIIRDEQGNLYGTAYDGGNSAACQDNNKPIGCGVIFALDTSGKEIMLHNFVSTDGIGPTGVNLYGGSLYGTTATGGNSSFAGVVFKWTR